MGSSVRKKKEKKKDFQKAKLKVGKQNAKPASFTDTNFKSKAIIVAQQSITVDGPNAVELFKHNLSLAATSRSDNQRRDALAFLAGQLSLKPPNNPVSTAGVLTKLLPLISDAASGVRTQLLKLLQALPPNEVRTQAEIIIMYVRAGMTHLSADVRDHTLDVMEWLLDVAGNEVVSCAGGWVKTLNVFGAMLGWNSLVASDSARSGWTSAPKSTLASGAKGSQSYARQILVLAKFLESGFRPEVPADPDPRAYHDYLYCLPRTANPFAHLNLFGPPRDEDGEMYADVEDRQMVFAQRWQPILLRGAEEAKKEGGMAGRAGAVLDQALKNGMKDYNQ